MASWLLLFALACVGRAGEVQRARASEVKAAFLFNFTKFVEWPESAFATGQSAFVIGILGPVAFTRDVERAVRGRTYHGRAIAVKRLRGPADATGAHLVFLGLGEAGVADVCRIARGRPILVVGETPAALRLGATIAFVSEGDKLRFALRPEPAKHRPLRISAQLLKLAKPLREDEE